MSNRLLFHIHSSRNKKGRTPNLASLRRREKILTLWWQHRTQDQIAAELRIDPRTVRYCIRRARRDGDPRAIANRTDPRRMAASVKRRAIIDLAARGMSAAEIATVLRCHRRLVLLRLKEASNG